MDKAENEERQSLSAILAIFRSIFIVVLIVLVVIMMVQIGKLKGTARVVNYAGIVRGATQRLVKLEMSGEFNEELKVSLDNITNGLKYGDDCYGLISLNNDTYQDSLDELIIYWQQLKDQIEQVRNNAGSDVEREKLLKMSEEYFMLADATVSAAEVYSDEIAGHIQLIEVLSATDMLLLIFMIIEQSVSAMRMRKQNALLGKKAYIDTHTGLQNKNRCEALLGNLAFITVPTACVVFDINNLKLTNDTMGHSVGDRLIADFAARLRDVAHTTDFIGRCGGDEFMMVLYNIREDVIISTLEELHESVVFFNSTENVIPISYAYGYAISTDYSGCTLRTLFDAADRNMYANKSKAKRAERG